MERSRNEILKEEIRNLDRGNVDSEKPTLWSGGEPRPGDVVDVKYFLFDIRVKSVTSTFVTFGEKIKIFWPQTQ